MQGRVESQQQEPGNSAREADEKLFLSLVKTCERMLLKVCWAYTCTSHDCDDLFQKIVIRLWMAT